MFTILVLDKRESIQSAIKYLLHRYDVVFSSDIKDAVRRLNESSIDMILVNLPLEGGASQDYDVFQEWTNKKKTIVLTDTLDPEIIEESRKFGALTHIDKMDISILPEVVNKYLNQAVTKILT